MRLPAALLAAASLASCGTAREPGRDGGTCEKRHWWEPPRYANTTLLFFVHVPHSGGTAVSWHLDATLRPHPERFGLGVATGSGQSSMFAGDAQPGWASEAQRWVGGGAEGGGGEARAAVPRFVAAYGHTMPSDPRLAKFGGDLRLLTMLRPAHDSAVHHAEAWACPFLGHVYRPWWNQAKVADAERSRPMR